VSIVQRQFGRLQRRRSPILSDLCVVRESVDWTNKDSVALAKCRSARNFTLKILTAVAITCRPIVLVKHHTPTSSLLQVLVADCSVRYASLHRRNFICDGGDMSSSLLSVVVTVIASSPLRKRSPIHSAFLRPSHYVKHRPISIQWQIHYY